MKQNLTTLDRVFRAIIGIIILWCAAVVFTDKIWQVVAALIGLGAVLEGLSGYCKLHARLGGTSKTTHLPFDVMITMLFMASMALVGLEWLSAGFEKLGSGTFPHDLHATLTFFASKNPFPWYRDFLVWLTSHNVTSFGYVIEWSQIAMGVALVFGPLVYLWVHSKKMRKITVVCMVFALVGGVIMNGHFYLASGWTSAGTKGVNYLMFWLQLVFIYFLVWLDDARLS